VTQGAERVRWIELGVISRPHGVTGELRVHVFNPESTLLQELEQVFLVRSKGEAPTPVKVVTSRQGPGALLMRLAGVDSREEADALRGYTLCVPRSALPEVGEGEYYHADLLGLDAFEGPKWIGKVVDVIDYPSIECLKIECEGGHLEVPMLPQWLDRIDIEAGRVYLKDLMNIPLQKGS
jgi:16S rRNA processing protein RimM